MGEVGRGHAGVYLGVGGHRAEDVLAQNPDGVLVDLGQGDAHRLVRLLEEDAVLIVEDGLRAGESGSRPALQNAHQLFAAGLH